MTEFIDGNQFSTVENMIEKAVATGVQSVNGGSVADIFTITGGPIQVVALIGRFETAVSAHACDMKLIIDPANGADTDLCLVVDIISATQYSWCYLTGAIGAAAVIAVPGTALPLGVSTNLILPPGTIDLNLANADPTTGTMIWYLRYKPLKTGVTVTGKA